MIGSLGSSLKEFRLRVQFGKETVAAAQQLWSAVLISGASKGIEVPIARNVHDKTMRAVFVMQQLHPEVRVAVRQSRSLILTLAVKGQLNISEMAMDTLLRGEQLANVDEFSASLERMLAGQDRFLASQGLDPVEMEREAKEAEQAKHAIEVGGKGEASSDTAQADSDFMSRLQVARAQGEAQRHKEAAKTAAVTSDDAAESSP